MSFRMWLAVLVGLLSRATRDDALFVGLTNCPRWVRRTRVYRWAGRRLMEHWHPQLKRR